MLKKGDMIGLRSITDLPNEIIEKHVLAYLSSKDVQALGMSGNKRFEEIANNVIDERTTKVLIAGGGNIQCSLSSSYILHMIFNRDYISAIKYTEVDEMPVENWMCFYQNCHGRNFIGGGRGSRPWDFLQNVTELTCSSNNKTQKWNAVPLLNVIRDKCPASCYIQNTYLVVAGGYHPSHGRLDSIELLNIPETSTILDDEDTETRHSMSKWDLCKTTLPIKVLGHTLSYVNSTVYLIGGNAGRTTKSNKAWKGSFALKTKEFIFESIAPMVEERIGHFSIVVKDQIHVFGGEKFRYTSVVEIFDGETWSEGPQFPFSVDRSNSNAVLNKNNIIIIPTNKHGIVIYNPTEKTIKIIMISC